MGRNGRKINGSAEAAGPHGHAELRRARDVAVGADGLAALDDAGEIRAAGTQAVEDSRPDGGSAIAARTGLLAAFEALGAQFRIAAAGARPIAEGLGAAGAMAARPRRPARSRRDVERIMGGLRSGVIALVGPAR